ncbi:hypothetical protein [uncultured Methylobacterium sp.]|uniref:hypothetical protein n=1 Tax=uncultured Methylobacterium sp. TaxID=157278 RepID=UPI0035CC5B00
MRRLALVALLAAAGPVHAEPIPGATDGAGTTGTPSTTTAAPTGAAGPGLATGPSGVVGFDGPPGGTTSVTGPLPPGSPAASPTSPVTGRP